MKNQEIDYNEEEFCDEELPQTDEDGVEIIP